MSQEGFTAAPAGWKKANLYLVLNGQSSKARKGTSWNHIVDLLLKADPLFGSQLVSGLSTGEGIVNHLRDKAEETTQEEEPAVVVARDKRMLAVETEFTRVLKVMGRQGNTLSTLLRDAWDKGDFQILNKNSPMKATGAHFSIVGHTTDEDAQRILEELRRRPEGMTRNQILDEVFSRNGSRADHDRAFEMLLKSELAYRKIEPTAGRNAERWFAT